MFGVKCWLLGTLLAESIDHKAIIFSFGQSHDSGKNIKVMTHHIYSDIIYCFQLSSYTLRNKSLNECG